MYPMTNRWGEQVPKEKPIIYEDPPARGGYKDDYWEVDMGDRIVRIHRPKYPIADMLDIQKDLTDDEDKKEELEKQIQAIIGG